MIILSMLIRNPRKRIEEWMQKLRNSSLARMINVLKLMDHKYLSISISKQSIMEVTNHKDKL
jgi:hypothetical protein